MKNIIKCCKFLLLNALCSVTFAFPYKFVVKNMGSADMTLYRLDRATGALIKIADYFIPAGGLNLDLAPSQTFVIEFLDHESNEQVLTIDVPAQINPDDADLRIVTINGTRIPASSSFEAGNATWCVTFKGSWDNNTAESVFSIF